MISITVNSQCISNRRLIECGYNNEIIKPMYYWVFVKGPCVDSWIPLTKGQQCQQRFHVLTQSCFHISSLAACWLRHRNRRYTSVSLFTPSQNHWIERMLPLPWLSSRWDDSYRHLSAHTCMGTLRISVFAKEDLPVGHRNPDIWTHS